MGRYNLVPSYAFAIVDATCHFSIVLVVTL